MTQNMKQMHEIVANDVGKAMNKGNHNGRGAVWARVKGEIWGSS